MTWLHCPARASVGRAASGPPRLSSVPRRLPMPRRREGRRSPIPALARARARSSAASARSSCSSACCAPYLALAGPVSVHVLAAAAMMAGRDGPVRAPSCRAGHRTPRAGRRSPRPHRPRHLGSSSTAHSACMVIAGAWVSPARFTAMTPPAFVTMTTGLMKRNTPSTSALPVGVQAMRAQMPSSRGKLFNPARRRGFGLSMTIKRAIHVQRHPAVEVTPR